MLGSILARFRDKLATSCPNRSVTRPIHPYSTPNLARLYDILGGITSLGDGHLGWLLGRRVFRILKVDIDRNQISGDKYTQ